MNRDDKEDIDLNTKLMDKIQNSKRSAQLIKLEEVPEVENEQNLLNVEISIQKININQRYLDADINPDGEIVLANNATENK